MKRPDMIVLVINFSGSDKSKIQVAAKEFIIGVPDQGVRGLLESEVEEGMATTVLSCRYFSLIKVPIRLPGGKSENRARGAIGLFQYLGSADNLEKTLQKVREVCNEILKKNEQKARFSWSGFEIYVAERW